MQIACEAGDAPSPDDVDAWLAVAAAESGVACRDCEVTVRVVDEPAIQELNRLYRGRDRPTNVLAVPADLDAMPGLPADAPRLLGDLVVCAPVVAREAAEQGKAVADHWGHMLVHGFLHLLGYDHQSAADAARMEALEARILAARGLENPYKDRPPS